MGACVSSSRTAPARPLPSPRRRTGGGTTSATTWTASACTTPISQGAHAFTVYQHGLVKKTTAAGDFIRSGTFAVGAYDWAVRYYPNGGTGGDKGDGVRKGGEPSVIVELMTKGAVVTAMYELKVVDQITGTRLVIRDGKTAAFDTRNNEHSCSGVQIVAAGGDEEMRPFVAGDFLTIECFVTIFGEPRVSKTNTPPPPPPSERSNIS